MSSKLVCSVILRSQPECWDYRRGPPFPVKKHVDQWPVVADKEVRAGGNFMVEMGHFPPWHHGHLGT